MAFAARGEETHEAERPLTAERALFAPTSGVERVVSIADDRIAIGIDRALRTVCIAPKGARPITLKLSTCDALICALRMCRDRLEQS